MAQRGRPKKQPIEQRLNSALDIAQTEINSLMPVEEQNNLLPMVKSPEVIVQESPKISKDVLDDYEFARNNLHNLLERGNKILEGIVSLTEESEHPRTFEVAGGVLKILLEGTRELMTLQKDIRDISKKSGSETENTPVNIENANEVTNNSIVFAGATTMEMVDILNELKRKKADQLEHKNQAD